ncbi:MAG TPA: DNA polymerase III subunit delta' [Planctomycetaceae bacterium]|nr:DNA polymerase III subunit delta' [Planctomycetaceae bacterium]
MRSAWELVRGHERPRAAFEHAIRSGRLTQGYVLAGPEGIGKQLFATGLAQLLLCQSPVNDPLAPCNECASCRPFLAGSHPDYHLVQRDSGKRELTIDKMLGKKEERGRAGLCHDLSLRPHEGSRKVAVINDADTMNDETANALLKTLEEPPERAVILLIANNYDALLPTIRSRCQVVRLDPLPDDVLTALLLEKDIVNTPQEAAALTSLANGSMSVAKQLAAPSCRDLRRKLLAALSQKQWNGIGLARDLAAAVEEAASDVPEQRLLATWLLRAAVEFYRTALWRVVHPGVTAPGGIPEAVAWIDGVHVDTESLVEWLGTLIERCLQAVAHLEQNVGVALCLEAAFADLARPGPGTASANTRR